MKTLPAPVAAARKLKTTGTLDMQKAPETPSAYARGERLLVSKGDLVPVHDESMDLPGRSATGDEVVVLGEAYESVGGNNRGEIIQQCKNPKTGALMGVPVSKLRRRQGDRSSRSFRGWEARAANAVEALENRKRIEEAWVPSRPGRKILKSTTTT